MYTEMMSKLIDFGADCHCYDAGDGVVCKVYRTPEAATFAFKMHTVALDWGIAPDLIDLDGHAYYCEKVKTVDELKMWSNFVSDEHGKWEMEEIIDTAFGCGYYDLHGGNLGVNRHGDYVLIDFGLVGWEHTRMARLIASVLIPKGLKNIFK